MQGPHVCGVNLVMYIQSMVEWKDRRTGNISFEPGVKNSRALNETPSQSNGTTLATWDHSVTCHPIQVNTSRRHPSQTRRYSIYLPWRDGRPSWSRWPRWFTHPPTVTHPSTNPAVHGRQSNSRPVDHKSDALTTTPPTHQVKDIYRWWDR